MLILAVFIVFTLMWFGCFLHVCGSGGCFAARGGFLVAFLCTAVVRQVCDTAVGLRLCVIVLSRRSVDRSSAGLTENVRGFQKGQPRCQPESLPKNRPFSTTAPEGLTDEHWTLYSPNCVIFVSKTPSSWAEETRGRRSVGGHKRSASWGSAEHLREASTSLH